MTPDDTPRETSDATAATTSAEPTFPVACVGASAGGVEALQELLGALRSPLALAVVVVLHRDPHQAGYLQEVLARATDVPVVPVGDGVRLVPGQVFVTPPDQLLELRGDVFVGSRTSVGLERARSLDHFLRSLAGSLGPRLTAVILSGTGSDGALGIAEVKATGGIVLAQDETARFDGMPRAALATGHVDLRLPPRAIAAELRRIAEHPYVRTVDEGVPIGPSEPSRSIRDILLRLRRATGVDFTLHKQGTLARRIQRRMALHRLEDVADYARLVGTAPGELDALFQDILIGVTGFFRDPEAFEALQRIVFPALLQDRPPDQELRVWVPGCSTGEEAYSLAICLAESLGDQAGGLPVKVFATDISNRVLERARAGYFLQDLSVDVGPVRLRRFFTREGEGYRVAKPIRDMCIFARQDVTHDPPFSSLDLISCRNVLIYFEPALQRRVIPMFHYALRPRGYLFLGSAESIGPHEELFDLVDKRHRIYAKNPAAARPVLHVPLPRAVPAASPAEVPAEAEVPDGRRLRREAERVLIQRYGARGVVVDARLQVLHVLGDTGPYLKLASGDVDLALPNLAREGLLLPLRELLDAARASGTAARSEGVRVRTNDHSAAVDLEVVPLLVADRAQGFLVLFDAPAPRATRARRPGPLAHALEALLSGRPAAPPKEVERLRQELAETRRYMTSLVEEQEAQNEKLRAANEEALSSNEELLSANEELETAKEELQASSEELATLNDELRSRNAETSRANDDLSNLISSIDLPIVILGPDRRIRRFTPSAGRVFNLIPSDRGRPVSDLRPRIVYPELEADIAVVLETVETRERDVQGEGGRWYHLSIRPYLTSERKLDGAVLTLVDVTELKEVAEQNLRRLAAVVRDSNDAITFLDLAGRIVDWNRGAERLYGYSREEALRLAATDLAPPELREEMRAFVLRQVAGSEDGASFETRRLTKDGRVLDVWLTTTIIKDEAGAVQGVATTERDVTERKRAEAALHADRQKDEFLSVLGHELRNPLSAIVYGLAALEGYVGERPDLVAARGTLARLGHQAEVLRRLVDDLLDVSRIARGELRLSRAPTDLASVVRSSVSAAAPLLEARRQTPLVTLPDGPVWVDGDEHRLEQVVNNLLHNATKFSPPGGRIWLTVEPAGEGEVSLLVRDEGVGIEAERLAGVFDGAPSSDERAARQRGLGLGLALVRRLVELHGGRVEARSEGRDRGSTFEVRLPRIEVSAGAPSPPRRRILLVEDEADVAAHLEPLLRDRGHDVAVASDLVTALEAFERFGPEVVLADVRLVDGDGCELARQLRRRPEGKALLLIALTGFGREEDRAQTRAAGFDHHLLKPLDFAALERVLAERFAATDGGPGGRVGP